jgi:DNA-binding SARP family transcriptional activator
MLETAHPARSALTLQTLGGAGLQAERGGALLLGMGKPLALLTFLALAPGRRSSRESLVDLLWSDMDRARGRGALRQALFLLRRIIGDDAIPGTEELTLAHAIEVDRDAFLAALERGDLEAAIERYRGPFLPAFGVPGGEAFERWASLERERLQTGFVRGAELLVRRQLNASRVSEARQLARRVQALAPDAEATARLVLETLIASRDFLSASMEANALEQRAAAIGDPLEPATRTAIARARRVTPPTDDAPDAQEAPALIAELTGREREFFAITAAWDAMRSGSSATHLHLVAAAGLGKSRLLRDAVTRLQAGGALVVPVRGSVGDRDLPYAFAGDLAGALAELPGAAGVAPASIAPLLALNPALSARFAGIPDTVSGEEALRRRTLAVTDLVHAVADAQRFVLAIDDLHWIDAESWRLLEGVWSRLGRARVLCLSASRPERAPQSESCVTIPLPPLCAEQVRALVAALGSMSTDLSGAERLVAQLHEATRGSPLLVLETLKLALDDGVLTLEQGEWGCPDAARLTALLDAGGALRQRVLALPADARWLLAVLATVGTPLERQDLADLISRSRDALGALLEPLERLGFVVETHRGLAPAHDEIGAAACDAVGDDARAEANRLVGAHFARTAGDDAKALMRAARHVSAGGDQATVQRLFHGYLRCVRAHGDRRGHRVLAAEFSGAPVSSAQVHTLVERLPRLWRAGLWSPLRQGAAAVAALLVPALAAATLRTRPADDAAVQRLYYADSTLQTRLIAVQAGAWGNNGAPLAGVPATSPAMTAATSYIELPPAFSPDGRAMAWIQDSGDSTVLDIWIGTPSGARRLTRALRDDIVSDWLPDGSALVGATERWLPRATGGYDIAVIDTATGNARQITHGPSHDTNPYASPDGTRIAFSRGLDALPPRVCVTSIDGAHEPECRLIGGHPVAQLIGWSGLDEIVLVSDDPAGRVLMAYDWARNTQRTLLGPPVSRGRLSPDRRWVVAGLRVEGVDGAHDWVVPLDRPTAARPVTLSERSAVRWWEGPRDQALLMDRLEFTDSASTMALGFTTRLRVRSRTRAGTEVPLRVPLHWSSSDTSIATVDSAGEVHPRREGTTLITAAIDSWRSTSARIRVQRAAPVTVLTETWDDRWAQRWIAWGDPAPRVATGPDGVRGFWNHGDGIHRSFGVLRPAFSARQGLGVEVRISSPVTGTTWQRLRTSLVASLDTTRLLAADQHLAPPIAGSAEIQCTLSLPGEGAWGATRASVSGAISQDLDLADAATRLRSGAWWTLRLQILPDGRCGVAIDGRVVSLSPEPLPLNSDFRVRLGDESNGTTLLHGPLQLWTGVRTDVDWSRRTRVP